VPTPAQLHKIQQLSTSTVEKSSSWLSVTHFGFKGAASQRKRKGIVERVGQNGDGGREWSGGMGEERERGE